jgi:NADH-quinone oxidoreductase subunit G
MELTNIVVDGSVLRAPAGANLLQACLSANRDIPYFCWHPALGSVGACRQCAVKIFRGPADTTGQIVMACMTKLTPGMVVSIKDAEAAGFRERVVAFVLTNHPHDCPVCEVGGDCHLQDMTALTGHAARRTRFPKRSHLNQDLGPFIKHEMNRCIGCYRCVRFYRDYAGGRDFGVFGANRNVYFGRETDGALESDFAGNLVEVCPTGVFVDKPFSAKFRRKWDMRATPSICPHCAVGCNITLQEREGKFRRTVNRFNETLNGYFLCDRGRFGTGFIESAHRLRTSRNRAGRLTADAAREKLSEILGQNNLIGIGSARASIESNFLLRSLVGPKNFYAAQSDHEAALTNMAAAIARRVPLATLAQAEQADAVLILGADPAAIAPRLALSLLQAAQRTPDSALMARDIPAWHDAAARTAGATPNIPFVIATAAPTGLDHVASKIHRLPDAERVEFAPENLAGAQNPVIVAGGSAAVLAAAANQVLALRRRGVAARLIPLLPEANGFGLALMNPQALAAAPRAGHDVIVLEADLARHGPAITADTLTVLDHIETATTQQADLAIAVGSFADADGMFVNLEGRAQRFYKAIFGPDDPPPAWALLRDAGIAAGRLPAGAMPTHRSVLLALAEAIPDLAPCLAASAEPDGQQTPTLPRRYSGRTAAHADADVREPKPPAHPDSPLGTTMEGAPATTIAPLVWSPGWNSGQAINRGAHPQAGVFLFHATGTGPDFDIPPLTGTPQAQPEELSARSPAIIARQAAP